MEDTEKPWLYPERPEISFSNLKKKKPKTQCSQMSERQPR